MRDDSSDFAWRNTIGNLAASILIGAHGCILGTITRKGHVDLTDFLLSFAVAAVIMVLLYAITFAVVFACLCIADWWRTRRRV